MSSSNISNVISIERVAFARGSRAAMYTGRKIHLERTMSTSPINSRLVRIRVALPQASSPVDVLALVTRQTPYSLELSMADDHGATCRHSVLLIQGQVPEHYALQEAGDVVEMSLVRKSEKHALLMVDGAAQHGDLTLLQATEFMQSQGLSASDALAKSVKRSLAVRSYFERVESEANTFLTQAA